MIHEISKKADSYLDGAVALLKELISYKSVAAEPIDDMPYGKDCADCLKFAARTLKADGFAVKNFDNHAITAAFDNREAELGILCHLDVVPTDGQDWHTDPFAAQIIDGKIYGRGAIDDKGPAAAIITAMRMIKDSGIALRKNVRLILGSNEENGSSDMEYYTSKEKFPPMLFTPDGSFPIINIEKGMVRYDMSCIGEQTERGIVSISGGSVYNAVPERAYAVVRGFSEDEIIAALNGIDGVSYEKKGEAVKISAHGRGAHASTPESGINAVTMLISSLAKLPSEDNIIAALRGLSEYFPFGENNGRSAGLEISDEKSGSLTLVLSRLFLENGTLTAGFDCRFPINATSAGITSVLSFVAAKCGMNGNSVITSEPHYADENSEMVQTLLKVYEDCTGDKGRCIAIGGGTYVHDTENGVAFGAEWSDENNMHGADEFIGIEELRKDIIIYTEAILRLCM